MLIILRDGEIYYCEPVFRPPSEAYSLLIQATEGCTYQCSFCVSNLKKTFKVRKVDDIKRDIDIARKIYGNNVSRIFFLDGNAMIMPYEKLLEITKYARFSFPHLERVSVYAHGKDILGKTDSQLKELSDAGLKMAYVGIETGDDSLLEKIGKRETSEDIVNGFKKLFKAGITPSGTIILGLAGNNLESSRRHAIKTAELVNNANPINFQDVLNNNKENSPLWYISALTLMVPPGTSIYKEKLEGIFHPMNADEILGEMRIFIGHLSDDLKNLVFRSNHASNYLAIKGILSKDKKNILELIDKNLRNHENIRPEYFRAL